MLRSLLILLPPSIAALLAWIALPGTFIDKTFFSLSSNTVANPPFFITGNGTHDAPHTLRTLRAFSNIEVTDLPLNVAIADDPERIFQSSPPSPVDFAIILKNIRRLGSNSVSIAMTLAWQEADMISLIALDQQLDAFSSTITSSPLSRNPVPSPIPPAFRRASIPINSVSGEVASIPIVNRIPIPDVILGKTRSLAGFSLLESEIQTQHPHLIARWDDRIVFSFMLLTAMNHFGSKIEDITIKPGRYISLGNDGPYIPIDVFGRLRTLPPPVPRQKMGPIPATELIDAPEDFFKNKTPDPAIVRNTLSSLDDNEILFSESIVPTIATLCHPNGTTTHRSFLRFPWISEILFLASLNCILCSIISLFPTRKRLFLLSLLLLILTLHFIIFITASCWPPTIPALIAILTTFLIPNLQPKNDHNESSDIKSHEPD